MTWGESLAPLRSKPFRRLVIGRTISMLGNGIAPIALAFAVLDLTDSATALGLVVAARSVTSVLFILVGGVVADRLPRHLVTVVSALAAGACQIVAGALVLTGNANVPLLAACAAVGGIASAFTFPAMSSLLGQVIDPDQRKSANAINRMGANAAMIIGASSGGILVAAFNPGIGLVIDGLTFAVAAFMFSLVKVPSVAVAPVAGERSSMIRDLRVGWREFIGRTWLWVVVLGFMFLNAAEVGAFGVLGPVIAEDTVGRKAFGLALAAETLGMVVGAVIALRWVRVKRLLLVGCVSMLLPVLPLVVLAVHPHPLWLIGSCFIAGVGVEQFGIAWETTMQEHVPADKLARVYSYDMLGSIVAIPAGQVAAGPAAAVFGPVAAITGAAGIVGVAVAGMVASRSVRNLHHNPTPTLTPAPVPTPV
ncbi:MFS family permease [Allocatelliglobosispora scoriae]|uniref:MFS family permease n=1 Tax=Allocatelliglobosispora scoriae TaxID=643052 RepID=A0A841BVE0_9ACTN|nr:MFS transporter [Allocatelliglobosispora scoriae]MBB5871129.1 MFS family permease [Allocatelliglobosispora scoriae]